MNRLQQSRRQKIGYTYCPQVQNNVGKQTHRRNIDNIVLTENYEMMDREGVMNVARKVYEKGKALVGKASDLYGSEIGVVMKTLVLLIKVRNTQFWNYLTENMV